MTSWLIAPATAASDRGRKDHANHAEGHATDGALKGNESHPPADVHEFVTFLRELSMTTTPAASVVTSLVLSERHADCRRQSWPGRH